MRLLELTLNTPAENLALDEALLDEAEAHDGPLETLRLWTAPTPLVVVGRSSRIDDEVRRERCVQLGVPILRRASGGAAIVAGPGCLMYALVLSRQSRPALRAIDAAHRYVLDRLAAAVVRLGTAAAPGGTSDLTCDGRKFSGNSLRCKRTHLLYHGTLLHSFPLALVGDLLKTPPRMPAYRDGRAHEAFVMNLPATEAELRRALADAWQASERVAVWPERITAQLVAERYGQPDW
jgi:lipoate---protein ligase